MKKNSLILIKTLKNQHFCDIMENILMGWQIEREDFMNKYKMITICSLSIVCILILSLLLPLTTSANDEESMEINLHYEKSSVTVNIAVNSEIYTGVICKYIEVDNILEYDDLEYQTKENGKTLNLNKLENDNYTTTIENVSKRYIVVYASIGNCSLCDYIDCKSNSQSTEKTETPKQNDNTTTEPEVPAQKEETTTKPEEPSQKENTTTEPEVPAQNESTTTEPEAPAQKENTTTELEAPAQNENTTTEPEAPAQNENTTTEPEAPEKNENITTELETSNENTTTNSKKSSQSSKTNNNKKSNNTTETPKVVDKDSINTDDFEEIQYIDKTMTASTSDTNMPQTGENDTAKIVGIIVFSIIGLISFYKYKESSKHE